MLLAAALVVVGLAAFGLLRWRGLGGLAVAAVVVLVVVLIVWWVVVLPARQAPPVPAQDLAAIDDPKARLEAVDARVRLRNELRNGALQFLLALAVFAGAVLGFQQLATDRDQLAVAQEQAAADRDQAVADRELTRQGQVSERFTRAVDQLGSPRVETRVGGIYGLAQVAGQAPDTNGLVGEVLLAFVNRQPRPKTRPKTRPTTLLSEHAPDLQAALTVLTTSDTNHDAQNDYGWIVSRLDLHGLDLAGANLTGADLTHVNLADADLTGANLAGADLTRADLFDARLEQAWLADANLEKANLFGADLSGANLEDANLEDAGLVGANLTGAHLSGTHFSGADLTNAKCDGPCPIPSP